ncbi:MAG: hypothetical protein ACL93V_13995 [Candidatus Electrothrix sp. YB6]
MTSDECSLTEADLENLKFISSTHRSLHDQRRKIEFRVLFTTVTFYASVSGAVLTGKMTLPSSISFSVVVWFLFFTVAGISSAYLRRIHSANQRNMTIAVNAENAVAQILATRGFPDLIPDAYQYRKRNQSFSRRILPNWLWETSILIIFALTAALITTWR